MKRKLHIAAFVLLLLQVTGLAGWPNSRETVHAQNTDLAAVNLAEADRLSDEVTKLFSQKKLDEAIPLAKRVLELREAALNPQHSRVASAARMLAELYILKKQFREAEPLLLRAIKIDEIARAQTDPVVIPDLERYTCVLTYLRKRVELENFEERRVMRLKQSNEPDRFWGSLHRITKAVTMEKPEYPREAIAARASGLIQIKVSLDEEGRVINAVGMCGGDSYLVKASADAARRARFKPILIQGKPVRLTGYLSYNFISR